jgi:hypothetical protein
MKVRVNAVRLKLLGGDPEFYETSVLPIPESLREELKLVFKEVEGCVVPMSFLPSRIDKVDDETGFECDLSHVHLEGLVPEETSLTELARLGLDFAFLLRGALLESRLPGPFTIIVSAHEPDLEFNIGPTCTVRFHRVRARQVWLADDLEKYKEEAIAICSFDLPSLTPR